MPIKANKQSNTHLGLGPKLPEWPYLIVVRVSLRISYNLQRVLFENKLELKILHTSLLSESKGRIHHLDEAQRKDGFPGVTTSASHWWQEHRKVNANLLKLTKDKIWQSVTHIHFPYHCFVVQDSLLLQSTTIWGTICNGKFPVQNYSNLNINPGRNSTSFIAFSP